MRSEIERVRTVAKRWYGLALGCILVWALVVSWATGHPRLRVADTVPPPGALLTEPPKEVKLVFSVEPGGLIPDQSLFWVVRQGPDEVVVVGRVDLTVADRNVMRAELKERLVPGVYLVKWVAVSLQDKGFAEGSYSFAVK